MTSPETNDYEFASNEQLAALWQLAQTTLEAYGVLVLDPGAAVVGERGGVPIATHQPNWEFVCQRLALQAIAPQAVEVFDPTIGLEVNFGLAYYEVEPESDDAVFIESYLSFTTINGDQKPEQQLFMNASEEGTYESDRLTLGEAVQFTDAMQTPDERVADIVDTYGLEAELGINRWTQREYRAMREVLDHMGEIKAYQDRIASE